MFGNINTRLTATEERVLQASHMAAMTSAEDAQPCSSRMRPTSATFYHQDAVHGMEDQVRAMIADCLRGVPTASFPMMDDESDTDDVAQAQVRRKPKEVSGKLHMTDTTVVLQVTWPHEVIYIPSGQLAIYYQKDSMAFVNGYLAVIARELEQINARMRTHLQELMEDGQHCGWLEVKSYHTSWL